MKQAITSTLLLIIITSASFGQTTVRGMITDKTGNSLIGASVIIKGSIDGASTDTLGNYVLKTKRKGTQTIQVSFVGYQPFEKTITLGSGIVNLDIVLKESPTTLNDVVITAGSFEAGDKKKGVTLKPLDIYTTASASGDMYGALTTLPGTATIGDDGRLFVRGGDAYESLTYIDGLRVKKPYSSAMPDLPSRGRYSPSLFTGTTFSTGGYSAQFGQALSSALILQTNGIPQENKWGFGLLSVGLNGSESFTNGKSSIAADVEYYNLAPYFGVVTQKYHWNKTPETFGATIIGRQKVGKSGLLKLMTTIQTSHSNLDYPDFDDMAILKPIDLKNTNLYVNGTYTDTWGKGWSLKVGAAFATDINKIKPNIKSVEEQNIYGQLKTTIRKDISSTLNITGGVEVSPNKFEQTYKVADTLVSHTQFTDYNVAPFVETEAMLFNKVALRAGIRGEYSTLLDQFRLAPRLSLAYLVGKYGQVSVATGIFYQTPEEQLLRFTHSLGFEKATHYILNYQYTNNQRIFRVEIYRKDYNNLVRFDGVRFFDPSLYNNNGHGYAQGFELFWRDSKSIRNLDYWVSYSYIDSKRLYRDFYALATPTFAPKHNFSAVAKWFVPKISTQFGTTISVASGRPYINPTSPTFMGDKTNSYFDISVNASYIFKMFNKTSVLYVQVGNLLGRNNIYGYNYYRDANNIYQRMPITAAQTRSYLFGLFINW